MIKRVLLLLAALVIALQVIPYGRDHDNPGVVAEPDWDSPRTRDLVAGACFDCHSNETRWPWYSHIAPFSWLIQNDVAEGRDELNFSNWDPEEDMDDLRETIVEGTMPPARYTMLHSAAQLTQAEMDLLLAGFESTFGPEAGMKRGEDD